MGKQVTTALFIATLACGPILLYFGAYTALLRPDDRGIMLGAPWARKVEYRMGGSVAKAVFSPIQWLDRTLFPDRWDEQYD
jgi:hypothetical protein